MFHAVSPFRKWGKRFAIAGTAWVSLFIFDTVLNDDVDVVLRDYITRRQTSHLSWEERQKLPKVVILGSGWGALSMIRKLNVDLFNVTVVSPRNYFLFTPLLASTTVGTLHQRSIVEPIRQFFNRSGARDADFVEAECTKVDFDKQEIHCENNGYEFDLKYDHLVLAVGCQSATFGIPGVAEHALFMKEIHQSYTIRDRILDNLEKANLPSLSQAEQDRLLTFVVVGGGPSGIEFSAELHDFLKRDVKKNYPQFADRVHVKLIEALPHILTMFDASLIHQVEEHFSQVKIDLQLNCQVKHVNETSLVVVNKNPPSADGHSKTNEEVTIPFGLLVWVTGNTPRPLIRDCMNALKDVQRDRRGLVVNERFQVLGAKNVFAIGDCAISSCPPTAQVAQQEGAYLGRLFNTLAKSGFDQLPLQPTFVYRHFGSFAYIGDHKAIAQIPSLDRNKDSNSKLYGSATFFLWRSVYFSKLLSYKNRFMVLTDWLKTAFFGRDVSRG